MIERKDSAVTLYEVSTLCGVSIATVSRVINNSPKVREKTRERVRQAMDQLGFHPNYAARALAGQKNKTVGVIFPDISSGFYAHVLKGIDRALAARGYHALTTFSHDLEDEKALAHRILDERRADALILMNLELPDSFIHELAPFRVPLILLDRPAPSDEISSVSINNDQGMMRILKYLGTTCRYRSLGILSGPKGTYDADRRLAACRQYAASCGLKINSRYVADAGFDHDTACEIVKKWMKRKSSLPDAIVALNDIMAIGAMHVFRENGIRVPEDVGVVGFDDVEYARLAGLTTVHVPLFKMGFQAGTLAMNAAEDRQKTQHIMIETELMVRSTCRAALTSTRS